MMQRQILKFAYSCAIILTIIFWWIDKQVGPITDYEDFNGVNITIDSNNTLHDLTFKVYGDNDLEPPETIEVSLVAHVDLPSLTMCTFIAHYDLESRIVFYHRTTTITVIDPGTSLRSLYLCFPQRFSSYVEMGKWRLELECSVMIPIHVSGIQCCYIP